MYIHGDAQIPLGSLRLAVVHWLYHGAAVITGPCLPEEIEHDLSGCGVLRDAGADGGQGGAGGQGAAGGEASAGGQGGTGGDMHSSLCSGQCTPPAPLGWFGPALLWFGSAEAVPDCPADAPTLGYEGFADLQRPPMDCAVCACDPPEAPARSPPAGPHPRPRAPATSRAP